MRDAPRGSPGLKGPFHRAASDVFKDGQRSGVVFPSKQLCDDVSIRRHQLEQQQRQ